MESAENPNVILKKKYDLHKSPEIESAAKRTQGRIGEKVPQNPLDRIQNYLNRFHEITDRENPTEREHGMDAIKRLLYKKFIIKPDEVPEGYFENQQRLAREQGHGDIEVTAQMRDQLTEVIIADQRSSLDKWIDYLSSPDAPYSDGLKYFTLRSVLNMAEYDKEKKAFPQRSKGTTKPFPDLNREALAYVLDAVEKKYRGENINLSSLETADQTQFEKLLVGENFPKLYAWAIEKITPASQEQLTGTRGEWIKFAQGSDPMPLVTSLQGHGTGWCTAGESTAKTQLQGGDFYVYYSQGLDVKPNIPRAAIRMQGNQIAEVRGIAPEQNLDSGITPVVEEKLKEFPDGASYQKKVADMRHLTEIENKLKAGQQPTGEDLAFLYEIDSSIEGFGYEKDPRITELRSQRNPKEDMPIVFGYSKDQIATSIREVRPDTKAYVGPLIPGIFDKLPESLEHIYTSFPERKIRREKLIIGGKTPRKLEQELEGAGINISSYAKDMLKNPDFTTLSNPEEIPLVRLSVADLGLDRGGTTDQIFQKAKELDLELCPAEVGPHLRLKDMSQAMGDWYLIAMKQIADSEGGPDVFDLLRYGDGLWLREGWARPARGWYPGHEFVFLSPQENFNTFKT